MVEITELWEAELLDSLILINVVPGISVVAWSLGQFYKYGGWNNRVVGGKLLENQLLWRHVYSGEKSIDIYKHIYIYNTHIPNRKNLFVNFSSLIFPGGKLGKSDENMKIFKRLLEGLEETEI